MTTPEPSVGERLVRIETKLDQALASHTDHETRLRKLERALWTVGGVTASAGGAFGALLTGLMGA